MHEPGPYLTRTDPTDTGGQPLGQALPDWAPPPFPPREPIQGRYCRLEPLDPERHAAALGASFADQKES